MSTQRGREGKHVFGGRVEFACPACGEIVDTNSAAVGWPIGRGMRWEGVPCGGCGKTYCVEVTDVPLPEQVGLKDDHEFSMAIGGVTWN